MELKRSPFLSLPIRMPGQLLQVECPVGNFQVTLKGLGDEKPIFEQNQTRNKWMSNAVHYALSRNVFDIIFEKDMNEEKTLTIGVQYSSLSVDEKTRQLKMLLKSWKLNISPRQWVKLPDVPRAISEIHVNFKNPTFKLAIAGVPLLLFTHVSQDGVLRITDINSNEKLGQCDATTLDFTKIFSAWLVFETDPFVDEDTKLVVTYV